MKVDNHINTSSIENLYSGESTETDRAEKSRADQIRSELMFLGILTQEQLK